MNVYLQYGVKVIKFHSYRTAWPEKTVAVISCDATFKSLQEQLIHNAQQQEIKACADNHTVFEIDGGISFAFSDWKIYIGIGVRVR